MVLSLFSSLMIPKRFLFSLLQCSLYRRAMVNKFWCQEATRKWFYRKDQLPHPRVFSEPKCQKHVATWYLLYRWLIFLAWACILVCSIFEIGSQKPVSVYDTWPIYLTNWDLALGVSQALLGCFLVSRRWKLQKISDFDPSALMLGSIDKIYWYLYVVTTNTAFGVTITYWCSIFDPRIHHLDPLNIMLHICNSLLIILDFCVTSIPFRLRNIWWCLIIVFLYTVFSLIYYLAGGLDKNGYHYIYKVLDWKKPVQASFVCLGEAILMSLLHSSFCFLEKIKSWLYLKVDKKLRKPYAETQISSTEKHANIV